MAAIKTLLPFSPFVADKVYDGTPKHFSDHPGAGQDFDHLMQSTLLSPGRSTNDPSTKGQPAPTTEESAIKPGGKEAARKVNEGKKSNANVDDKISSEAHLPAISPETPLTSSFLSLPMFLRDSFGASVTPAKSKSSDSQALSAVSAQPDNLQIDKPSSGNRVTLSSKAPPPGNGMGSGGRSVSASPGGGESPAAGKATELSPDQMARTENAALNPQNLSAAASLADGVRTKEDFSTEDNGVLSAAAPTGDSDPDYGVKASTATNILPVEGNFLSTAMLPVEVPVIASGTAEVAHTSPGSESAKTEFLAKNAMNSPVSASSATVKSLANITPKTPDSKSGRTIANGTENAGTGVANIGLQMKNSQKTTKVAEQDVKVLPVREDANAPDKNLPARLMVSPVRAADNSRSDVDITFAHGHNHQAVAETKPTANFLNLPALTDTRMRALERTQDMVALHAMRLVESKSDTLSVVIKPAVGMEMSLELHVNSNGIQAHATLTQGDRAFLNQYWPELQERLEQRGVKLSLLDDGTGASAHGDDQYQPRKQVSDEEVAQQASAFAEFAVASQSGGASARLAVIHDGWESWA